MRPEPSLGYDYALESEKANRNDTAEDIPTIYNGDRFISARTSRLLLAARARHARAALLYSGESQGPPVDFALLQLLDLKLSESLA